MRDSSIDFIPQLQGTREQEKLSEKYPSFGLVLNFVKNDAISTEKVHGLLQQRAKLASSVAQVYTLAAEYIRTIGVPNVFEVYRRSVPSLCMHVTECVPLWILSSFLA